LDQAGLESLGAPQADPALIKDLNAFAADVLKMMEKRIGSIRSVSRRDLPLEESGALECRKMECLTGNIVTDALRAINFNGKRNEDQNTEQIVVLNGGALRNSLPAGEVTPGHVLATLPFQNTPVTAQMTGAVLMEALEHGVSAYGEGKGSFLQVSALRYAFNPKNAPGKRVTKAEVLSKTGDWLALDEKALYQVVTIDYLAKGGDGFAMFKPLKWKESENLANDAVRRHLEKYSPIEAEFQGRIEIQ
jgi:5'-nucleotidase